VFMINGRSSDLRVILRAPSQLFQSVVVSPFVIAYSGGSVEDLHLTSLSSPCGHRDRIFCFRL